MKVSAGTPLDRAESYCFRFEEHRGSIAEDKLNASAVAAGTIRMNSFE